MIQKTQSIKLVQQVVFNPMKNTLYTDTEKLVVARGKLYNDNVIKLPDEWEQTVNPKTITVSLTSCGASQDIVVKTVDIKEIRLQSYSKIPMECYYLVLAETK
jgi:hypothetical protein